MDTNARLDNDFLSVHSEPLKFYITLKSTINLRQRNLRLESKTLLGAKREASKLLEYNMNCYLYKESIMISQRIFWKNKGKQGWDKWSDVEYE